MKIKQLALHGILRARPINARVDESLDPTQNILQSDGSYLDQRHLSIVFRLAKGPVKLVIYTKSLGDLRTFAPNPTNIRTAHDVVALLAILISIQKLTNSGESYPSGLDFGRECTALH
eukprot:1377023-Amorphochlora_amoeboformis.AAC.1